MATQTDRPEELLAAFYGHMTSLERVLGALRGAGVDVDHLHARDLYERNLDCQNLGAFALVEVIAGAVAEHVPLGPVDHVLDVGCGIGGPGRFLVERFGCNVTGVDLLPSRLEAAEALTARCGLARRIAYRLADVVDLPFEDSTFSQVWMLDVGVHVRDKAAMFRQLARVLQPGGMLVVHDQPGPLPAAMRPLTRDAPYHAPSLPRLVRLVEAAGLRLVRWQDTTAQVVASFEQLLARPGLREPAPGEHEPPWRRFLRVTSNAYLTTLAHRGGRTGMLLARRPAAG